MPAPPSDPSELDSSPSPVLLQGSRIQLLQPPPTRAKAVLRYYWENRTHLAPWSPPHPPGYYSEEFWRHRLAANRAEYLEDRSLRLLVASLEDDSIIGNVGFTEIRRGALQACCLGYSVAATCEGKGFISEALSLAIPFVFERLALHRIEAAYVPHNRRSARVLERLGFAVEGYAHQYLYIAGEWRDHVLTSLTNPNLSEPGAATR
ncbi:MAG: GNAT family N-acetyltransferase [Polyangiaceae bacterium]